MEVVGITGMSFQEFVIIFEVLISGLAIAHLLDGLGAVILSKPRYYWNHMLFVVLTLMLIINHWWLSFQHEYALIVTNIFQFIVIL